MVRATASRRARNSASVSTGGRRRPWSRPSRRRWRLASSRVEPADTADTVVLDVLLRFRLGLRTRCSDVHLSRHRLIVGLVVGTLGAAPARRRRRRRRVASPAPSAAPSSTALSSASSVSSASSLTCVFAVSSAAGSASAAVSSVPSAPPPAAATATTAPAAAPALGRPVAIVFGGLRGSLVLDRLGGLFFDLFVGWRLDHSRLHRERLGQQGRRHEQRHRRRERGLARRPAPAAAWRWLDNRLTEDGRQLRHQRQLGWLAGHLRRRLDDRLDR